MSEVYHIPVLLKESVDGLNIRQGGTYADVTFGGGGHSREILRRLDGKGRLFAFDQDADAEKNLVQTPDLSHQTSDLSHQPSFTFVRSNFRYLWNFMRYYGVEELDGVLADLGVSSHHFDTEERGFSFRFDAPPDMRMNAREGLTAADVLNDYDEEQLANIFYLYGELRDSRRLAQAVVKTRGAHPFRTTNDLLEATRPLFVRDKEKKEVTKLFQALRIEVNHEMDALSEMLAAATDLLRPGGRLVVLTYHSLEDRLVKNLMKAGNMEGRQQQDFFGNRLCPYAPVGKVVTPSPEEQQSNPRSRSAKLRVAEKVYESTSLRVNKSTSQQVERS